MLQPLSAAYPNLGCIGEGYKVRTHWGVFPEVFCAGKESTFEFLQNVLEEVIKLFPSEYIHVGGEPVSDKKLESLPRLSETYPERKSEG